MKKWLACLLVMLLSHFVIGCGHTYDGSEKAYGMHPEWTDHQPAYMPADENGTSPDN